MFFIRDLDCHYYFIWFGGLGNGKGLTQVRPEGLVAFLPADQLTIDECQYV